jgi:recombination protein RecA
LADPPPGSAAVEVLNILAASGEFGLIVFDSIGAMSGDKESEPGEKKQAYGQSALVTQMVKAVNDDIKMNGTTCLFLNQVREKAGKFFTIEDTPGGRAIKHHASVRIYLKSGAISVTGTVDKEKAIIMKSIVAKAVKNKVAAPNKTATFNFWMYPSPEGVIGVDKAQEAIDLAFRLGAIDQSGAYYTHPVFPEATKHRIQGKEKVALFLRENPDVLDQLRTDLMTKQYAPTEEPEVSDMEEELEDVE